MLNLLILKNKNFMKKIKKKDLIFKKKVFLLKIFLNPT